MSEDVDFVRPRLAPRALRWAGCFIVFNYVVIIVIVIIIISSSSTICIIIVINA